jgi:superfamily I DNA/RNA helicase
MEPSNYQLAVYKEIQEGKSDILVRATAGSGKTTTIVNASKFVPSYLRVGFCAFNKHIVNELKGRLPDNVECSTLHSFGYRSLFKHYRYESGFKIDSYKTATFVNQATKEMKIPYKEMDKMKWVVTDILEKARINHIPNENNLLMDVADYYGIVFEDQEMNVAMEVYEQLMKYNSIKIGSGKKLIDFTDMVYLPSFYEVKTLPKFDVLFVDEAQDLNKAQQILVDNMRNNNGRVIYVGDENQAIYRFAGADAQSFNSISNENTISLPLSVCYRCAKNIVVEASRVVGDENIKPFEGQELGVVKNGKIEEIKEGDFVLCRNNAPLFSLYFDLLTIGIKAVIKGREIENQLKNLVKKVKFSNVETGLEKLDRVLEKILEEQIKKGHPSPEKSKRYQNYLEMINIIKFLSEGKEMMVEVHEELEEIFREDRKAATLMTIHKSKGLECDTVHFLNPELIPSKWAESVEEKIQENNLKFVAITRAKHTLNYIYNYESRVD